MRIGYDDLAVGIIGMVAVLWAVRAIVRAVRAKKICATCASSGDCPLTSGKEPVELEDFQKSPPDSR